MLLSFFFIGRILWFLTVTNKVVKSSKKTDALIAIQNKFCNRDQVLTHRSLPLHWTSGVPQLPHRSQEAYLLWFCRDDSHHGDLKNGPWIRYFSLQAARIVLTHIQLLVKIIWKVSKYCWGRKMSGITINFIKIHSRCYKENEYSFYLVSTAIHFVFRVIAKYPNSKCLHCTKIQLQHVCGANSLSFFCLVQHD